MPPRFGSEFAVSGAAQHIANARIAALVLGTLGLGFSTCGYLLGLIPLGTGIILVPEAALMFWFARGYAKRDRLIASICLGYQAASLVLHWKSLNEPGALAIFLVFGYFFLRGTLAVRGQQPPG